MSKLIAQSGIAKKNSEMYKEVVEMATGNAGTNASQGFTLGGRYTIERHPGMKFKELGKISGELTSGEISDLSDALKTKWGIA